MGLEIGEKSASQVTKVKRILVLVGSRSRIIIINIKER